MREAGTEQMATHVSQLVRFRTLPQLIVVVAVTLLACSALGQEPFFESRLRPVPDPIGYYNLVQEGIGSYSSGKFAEAVPKLRQAVDIYPDDGMVWLYLGLALRSSGQPKEAVEAYNNALRLKSSGQPMIIYQWLARAYIEAGDKENAYKSLEKAVFEEPHVNRAGIYDDPAFRTLRVEPRFLKLVGRVDTTKMSRTEGWRMDIDYLLSEVTRVNHKYKKEPLPTLVLQRQRELKRDVPKLTDDEIFVRMGAMLAPLNQGHITIALTDESRLSPVRSLPLQFYAFPEGVFVVGSDEARRDLVGAQVLKVENTEPGKLLARIEEHASVENKMRVLWGIGSMGVLQTLRGLGVVKPKQEDVRLTFLKDGRTFERTLPTVKGAPPRKLVPPLGVTAPYFLKNVPRAHWFEKLPEADALFVQLNQVAPDPDESIAQFGLKLRSYLGENPTKNLILDVRHNNGGNTSTYPELLRTLIAHTTKEGNRLYVIIGRGVYSATGNLITDLERLADPIFVGEPSSGFGNQDGDESSVVLPYSGIRGWLTSVWWQLSHPWDKRTSIVPQVPVQLTAQSYFGGKDPALETILKMIGAKP